MPATAIPAHVDVLIVGGGPVGGALALTLADTGLIIALVEAKPEPVGDARALALSHASREALAPLGVWPAQAATAIHTVHVSQQHTFGRVKLSHEDLDLPALGYVMPYAALARAMHQQLLANPRIHYLPATRVGALKLLDGYAAATLQREGSELLLTASLAVLAEGGKLLASAGIAQDEHDYAQHALVAEVTVASPHKGRAFERFACDGPIALLPIDGEHGCRYAAVWTRPSQDPLQAASLPDVDFLHELQARVGQRAGLLTAVGARASFPLRLKWAGAHHARRLAVVGNAAQTLHPVAGQGFNLGLRDALALARLIKATPTADLGGPAMLARYASLRRRDSLATVGFTDGLIRLFGLNLPPLKRARSYGMLALDSLKPLRRGFARRMVFGTP
ncbi:FAD-dependent monooxygenase [Chitinimonas sp.]|uniref:FAD-dependent monooxygenase n=1 Tax=Chitinimonas sp. TaxID=1934313 RepID=UPI0035B17D63